MPQPADPLSRLHVFGLAVRFVACGFSVHG